MRSIFRWKVHKSENSSVPKPSHWIGKFETENICLLIELFLKPNLPVLSESIQGGENSLLLRSSKISCILSIDHLSAVILWFKETSSTQNRGSKSFFVSIETGKDYEEDASVIISDYKILSKFYLLLDIIVFLWKRMDSMVDGIWGEYF